MKKKFAISIAAITAVCLTAKANEQLEEVIITANRMEQPLSQTLPTANVITRLDIERMLPADLPSLLGRISGINFTDSGGRGSVSSVLVRGTTSSQVMVLIDGVRTASATTGAMAFSNIPLHTIERIEVVKGPLSGLYGADAMGGVIQVITKKGNSDGLIGSLHSSFGSNNLSQYGGSLSTGNEQLQLFAAYSKEKTDGIDRTDLKDGGNGDKDAFKEESANLSLSAEVNEKLNARISYLWSKGYSDFDNTFGTDTGFFSKSELENISVKFSYQATDDIKVSFNAGHLSDYSFTPAFFSEIETKRSSIGIQADFEFAAGQLLTAGYDFYNDDVNTLSNFSESKRYNKGYFVQWQAKFGPVSTVTSLRYDDNEAYGDNTNGSLAAAYNFNDELKLVASYGTAFKAPSFNDLYYPFYGSLDVLPEESETFELSLRGSHANIGWRINAYRSNIDELIGFDVSTFTAGNVAQATLEGIELELDTHLDDWDLGASFSYLDARDESTNNYLDDRVSASASLVAGRSFQQLYLSFDLKAEHGRHDRGGIKLPGFGLFGLSAVYNVTDQFKLSGRIDNLFDKDYTLNLATATTSYETEGTTAKLSLEYSFK